MRRLRCSSELFRQWVNRHPERHPRLCGYGTNVTLTTVTTPPTSPSPLWVWDERHPHDQLHSSNVPRTSPSRPLRTIGRRRSPQERQWPITDRSDPGPGLSWPLGPPRPRGGSRRRLGRLIVSGSPTPPEAAEHDCKGPIAGAGPSSPGTGPLSPLRPFWPALASRWPHEPEGRALVVTCGALTPELIASVTSASLTKRRPGGHRARRGRRQA